MLLWNRSDILGEDARTAAIAKLAERRRKNAVAILLSALAVEPKVLLEGL
jgi:hypothetical protein